MTPTIPSIAGPDAPGSPDPHEPGTASDAFRAALDAFRDRLDAELDLWLRSRQRRAASVGPEAGELVAEVSRLVASGGKRLRPALLDLAYRACGGGSQAASLRLGMAVELLHTYLLIHDDIMDHAPLRRGRATTHAAFSDDHRERGRRGDADDFGRAVAILAGDLAHTWAAELSRPHLEAEGEAAPVARTFDAMCEEVIGGQYLEMLLSHRPEPDEAELGRVLRMKTGRYTVERPVELGALLAGAGADLVEGLRRWGEAAGEAFQLQDDVLGVFGDAESTGKSASSDVAEGKHTFLIHHALDGAAPEDREWLRAALGRDDLDDDDHERVRRVVRDSGGLAAVQDMIDERLDRARRALAQIPVARQARVPFESFLDYLQGRDR